MNRGYIQLYPTSVPLCDPARPGGTVESTVWGYRAVGENLVWYQFESERGKSPEHPERELKAANFTGTLQRLHSITGPNTAVVPRQFAR